jgi:quercetin dioxygenase-like cupin family protein
MRRVITGLDENGRSTVLHDGPAPVVFAASDKSQLTKVEDPTADLAPTDRTALVHELWRLNDQPSASGIDPTTALILTEMGPGSYTPMHSTPSVDYAVVVAGDVVLGLENGSVHLYAGDTMLVNAVKHTWEAGANGAVLATVLVGLRDDERGAATGTDFPTD